MRCLLVLAFLALGCASAPSAPLGPVEVHTSRVVLRTTLTDRARVTEFAREAERSVRLVEEAFGLPPATRPVEGWLFASRAEWTAFTRERLGDGAAPYLRLRRGAYARDAWFALFDLGGDPTRAAVRHEAAHAAIEALLGPRRPPAALEEGMATQLETGTLDRVPPARVRQLARGKPPTFDELIDADAGAIAGGDPFAADRFYAGCWAAFRFARESGALRVFAHDGATVERAFGASHAEIARRFDAFVRKVIAAREKRSLTQG